MQIAMDAKNPVVLRQNAIISLPNAERSVEFLEKTVSEEEGIIAFQALKQLNVIAPQKAEQISREIIANWKQVSELKLSQALKVESKNIKENRIIGETDTFISTCSDILKTVEHQNLCDTVFFALEDLDNVEAVKVIVQSDNIDDLLKEYCVSQNEKIILEYMNSDEAKQDEIFLGKIKSFGDLNCSKTNKQSKKNNLSNETVQRAGDYSGYTVYRDGAALGLNWHAGLMVAPTAATAKCVIHMNDVSDGVKLDTFKNFMDKESNTYKGVYKPKSGLTSSKKTAVIATARKLTTENIPYVISQQLDYYNKTSNGTQKGEPSDISNIRCDGVVEYCYEYNGIRIYGNDTYWDISKRSLEAVNHHAATKITPKKQAENNMTLVAASMPGYVS